MLQTPSDIGVLTGFGNRVPCESLNALRALGLAAVHGAVWDILTIAGLARCAEVPGCTGDAVSLRIVFDAIGYFVKSTTSCGIMISISALTAFVHILQKLDAIWPYGR